MTPAERQSVAPFLDLWISQFQRSIEMFSGRAVSVQRGPAPTPPDEPGSMLWVQQVFEGKQTASMWVGTPRPVCLALTSSMGEAPESGELLYRELLEQAFDATAQAWSEGQVKLALGQASRNAPPDGLAAAEALSLELPGLEQARVLIFIDDALIAEVGRQTDAQDNIEKPAPVRPLAAPLECLTDIELPVSVVLGRAKVRIREALKLTAGSLVELDRRVGDLVEIVVHNVLVARGEVVSVKGNYGVRILEVSSQRARYALQASNGATASVTRRSVDAPHR